MEISPAAGMPAAREEENVDAEDKLKWRYLLCLWRHFICCSNGDISSVYDDISYAEALRISSQGIQLGYSKLDWKWYTLFRFNTFQSYSKAQSNRPLPSFHNWVNERNENSCVEKNFISSGRTRKRTYTTNAMVRSNIICLCSACEIKKRSVSNIF